MSRGCVPILALAASLCLAAASTTRIFAQSPSEPDTDRDGLPDRLESQLLAQFRPTLMVGAHDCSNVPARFETGSALPRIAAEDGTIYVQAHLVDPGTIELHYFHLWRRDCGELGHPLDAEHVSALLESHDGAWHAVAWYAAAHEDTVCDAGQLTRASTIDAIDRGPRVWISSGKHASYFAEKLCNYGCGGDRCQHMQELPAAELINLGEPSVPTVAWTAAKAWPLLAKMSRTDFTAARMARLDALPATDIAWSTPEKRPAEAAILGANAGLGGAATGAAAGAHGAAAGVHGAATGARATDTAMVVASSSTGGALATAAHSTGDALRSAHRNTAHAIGRSLRGVRRGLGKMYESGESVPK